MKLIRNKKGDKIISVYWFVILFLVAAAVVYMTVIFYGTPKDIRNAESEVLANKIAECLSEGGYLKEGILEDSSFKDNLLSKCNINFNVEDFSNWKEKTQYYLEIAINKFDSALPKNLGENIFSFNTGDINLKTDYLLKHTEKERAGREIDMIVLHYSVTPSAQRTVEVLEQRGLSIHYIVDKDGTILSSFNTDSPALVDEGTEAGHAGCVRKGEEARLYCHSNVEKPNPNEFEQDKKCCVDVNFRSIGIEIVNMGNEEYTPEQIIALENLVSGIVSRYDIPINRTHIVGHEEVAPGYKPDPGPLFPWEEFMANVENQGEEFGLGREFYAVDKTNNQYIVKVLPLIGKGEKNGD